MWLWHLSVLLRPDLQHVSTLLAPSHSLSRRPDYRPTIATQMKIAEQRMSKATKGTGMNWDNRGVEWLSGPTPGAGVAALLLYLSPPLQGTSYMWISWRASRDITEMLSQPTSAGSSRTSRVWALADLWSFRTDWSRMLKAQLSIKNNTGRLVLFTTSINSTSTEQIHAWEFMTQAKDPSQPECQQSKQSMKRCCWSNCMNSPQSGCRRHL